MLKYFLLSLTKGKLIHTFHSGCRAGAWPNHTCTRLCGSKTFLNLAHRNVLLSQLQCISVTESGWRYRDEARIPTDRKDWRLNASCHVHFFRLLSRGKGGHDVTFTARLPVNTDTSLEGEMIFPRSHAHSTTFEMQMVLGDKGVCEQLFKLLSSIRQQQRKDSFK